MGWPARAKINLWGRRRRVCATRSLRKAILRYGRSKRPFKDQPVLRVAGCGAHPRICRAGPFAIEVALKFRQNPARVQNRDSTRVAKPRGPLEEESVQRKPLEEDPVLRTPGRPQKSIWTPGRHQAGKDLLDSLGRHQGGTSEQERTIWTACEAPGRHQGGRKGPFWTAWEAPGRHQGGRKGPFGQPGRHQGGTREVGKD